MYGSAHPPFRRDSEEESEGDFHPGPGRMGGGGLAHDPYTSSRPRPGQGPPRRAPALRPTTLSHVDLRGRDRERMAREERDQRARTMGPGIVVHPFSSEPPPPPDDHGEGIRPRANSGRHKLQRRRKYDSYVHTLEPAKLQRLDDDLIQCAACYEDWDEPEPEEAYGQADEDYGHEHEGHGMPKVVQVRQARSTSPRRERLCEEDLDDDEECKRPSGRYAPPNLAARGSNRYSVPRTRNNHRYENGEVFEEDSDAGTPYLPEDSPHHRSSVFGPLPRVRFYRDGTHHTAPHDDAGFHDLRAMHEPSGFGPNDPTRSGVVSLPHNPQRHGRRDSAEMAADEARHGDPRVSWLADLNKDAQGGKGPPLGAHRRTLLEWVDRSQRVMGDDERVSRAALYLQDAIETRPPRHYSRGAATVRAYAFSKGGAWNGFMTGAAVLHLLLALWEPPRSLANSVLYHDSVNVHALRMGDDTAHSLLGLECFLVLLYLFDLMLEIFALGPAVFFALGPPPRVVTGMPRASAWAHRAWSQLRFLLVLLFLLDVSGNINGAFVAHFSRALRPLFLVCVCDPLKRWAVLLWKLVSQLRDVAFCCSIVLGLFALTGLILFSETGYYANGLRFQNFNNFFNSVVALYVLISTQNFGDLLDPAYNADPKHSTPLYFFWFASFVLVLVLFLSNLALPRVYWVFQAFQRQQAYQARTNERLALLLSFRCLDAEKRGYINLNQFGDLMRHIRPELFDPASGYEKRSCQGAVEHMFLQLATEHEGRIYPRNFFSVCEVALMDFDPPAYTLRTEAVGHDVISRTRETLRTLLSSRLVELASLVLLLLSLFFLSFYGSPSIDKDKLRGFSYFVIVVFTVEVVLKIWAFGPRSFFSTTENTLDSLVVGAAFMSIMVYGCAGPESRIHRSEQLANLGLLFLTFRGVRLFPKCDIFAKFQCAFTVLPFFFFSFVLCLLLVYAWAAIGMACFSGLNRRPTHADFGNLVSINNFESFWGASVTLFQVAATHDWYRTMYLWMDLSDTSWTAVYFVAFHAIAHLVAVQLTTALFLDAFLSFDGKRWMEHANDDDVSVVGGPGNGKGPEGPTSDSDPYGPPRMVVPEAPEQPPEEECDPLHSPRPVNDVPAPRPISAPQGSYPHMSLQMPMRGSLADPPQQPTHHSMPHHARRHSGLGYPAATVV